MDGKRRAGIWLLLAGLNGAVGTVAGALAAHASAPAARALVETGAHYQLVHAMALGVIALLTQTHRSRLVDATGLAFLAGCILFAAGLYSTAAGFQAFIILTPFGGAAFIAGWSLLAVVGLRDWLLPPPRQ